MSWTYLESSANERGRATHFRQQDDNEGWQLLTREERDFLNSVIHDANLNPNNVSWKLNEIERKVDAYFNNRREHNGWPSMMVCIIMAIIVIVILMFFIFT